MSLAVGAFGATLAALLKGKLTWNVVESTLKKTLGVSCMFNGSENVTIDISDEDISLDAWWKEGDTGMPAIILIHGIRSCKKNHEVLIPASMLVESGYSVLIPTLRDHGDSTRDDGRVDGGITEWKDVVDIKYKIHHCLCAKARPLTFSSEISHQLFVVKIIISIISIISIIQ